MSDELSVAPSGAMRAFGTDTHGSRRGLNSAAPPGLAWVVEPVGNNINFQKPLTQGNRIDVRSQPRKGLTVRPLQGRDH